MKVRVFVLGLAMSAAIPLTAAGGTGAMLTTFGEVSTFFCYDGNFCGYGYPENLTQFQIFPFKFNGKVKVGGLSYLGPFKTSGAVGYWQSSDRAVFGPVNLHGHNTQGKSINGSCNGNVDFQPPVKVTLSCVAGISGGPSRSLILVLYLVSHPRPADLSDDGPKCICSQYTGAYTKS